MKKPRAWNSSLPAPTKGLARAALSRGTTRLTPKKRKPSEFNRIYGSRERVRWVKSLPCVVADQFCGGPIQNAHTENGGMSRKADASSIVPACRDHHAMIHNGGAETVERMYRVDLKAEAAKVEAAWVARLARGAA